MAIKEKTLMQLFIPIGIETLFYMLAGMVDTLMLSSISDQAVGAVGTANAYLSMFILMFAIVSTGMMAVMTQNIGANRNGVAYQAKNIGIVFNLILGILLSAFLYFGAKWLLVTIGISKSLEELATTYITIVGSTCFINALIPVFSGYLRSFGFTKYPLYATIFGNIVNLLLNSLFLFYFHFGVVGVAIATVISKIANLLLVFIFSTKLINSKEFTERIKTKIVLKQIIKIGFPFALENLIYNFAITFAIKFLNQMDSEGFNVAARAYASQIANFTLIFGSGLAQANAIKVGWRIGRKEYEKCSIGTKKALYVGILFSTALGCLIAISAQFYLPKLTDNPEMIKIVTRLLWLDVILEIGRSTNLIYGSALKTCGDAVFPVVLGVIFMSLLIAGGTYFLGIAQGLLVTGCYIALTCDECFRGIGMFLRWKSGKWQGKGLI